MATTFVSANRVFAQPEIDGGTFFAPTPTDNIVVIIRQFQIVTAWVQAIQSAGSAPTQTLAVPSSPPLSLFNTLTSAGFVLTGSTLSAGRQYAWGSFGVGG